MTDVWPSDCTATFTIEPFDELRGRFNGVNGEATHPTFEKVATLSGYLTAKRDVWRETDSFIQILDDESLELREFATQFYDQFESSADMSHEDLHPEKRHPLHYIHKPGPDGFTPLHLAVIAENVNAVRALVELDVTEDLNNAANTESQTPLETIEQMMWDSRAFIQRTRGFWTNYSSEYLTIEYLLKRAMHLPLLAQDETEYIAKRKHGCSCGECWEGWFSKRMKFRLEKTASIQHKTLDESINGSKTGPCIHDFDIDEVMIFDIQYIPLALRPKVDHSLVIAWCKAFLQISDHLNAPPTPGLGLNPVIDTTSQSLQPIMKEFLRVGARIEYVLDALMDIAEEQSPSPFGDGTFEEEHSEMYDLLPQCSNDLAFDLVRHKIGLDTRERWAPYYETKPLEQDADFDDDYDSDIDEDEYW